MSEFDAVLTVRRTRFSSFALLGALVGMLPDADLAYPIVHRGVSHSLGMTAFNSGSMAARTSPPPVVVDPAGEGIGRLVRARTPYARTTKKATLVRWPKSLNLVVGGTRIELVTPAV